MFSTYPRMLRVNNLRLRRNVFLEQPYFSKINILHIFRAEGALLILHVRMVYPFLSLLLLLRQEQSPGLLLFVEKMILHFGLIENEVQIELALL